MLKCAVVHSTKLVSLYYLLQTSQPTRVAFLPVQAGRKKNIQNENGKINFAFMHVNLTNNKKTKPKIN